jgi:hypothetical protein
MRALSIRQPYAELILRGIKTVEYRSRPTRIIGERFYIYASKGTGRLPIGEALTPGPSPTGRGEVEALTPDPAPMGNGDDDAPTPALSRREAEALPRGLIVGSAVISHVTEGTQAGRVCHQWHLSDVRRLKRPRRPRRMPQPVWFRPF